MKKTITILISISIAVAVLLAACTYQSDEEKKFKNNWEDTEMIYYMPAEDLPHEGTWLTWPHRYTYGTEYQNEIEDIWVQMTHALHRDEKVHIIAYNKSEQKHIEKLLAAQAIDLRQIDFVIAPSDDVWTRDTGPIFVFDEDNKLSIADFKFDGWGKKTPYQKDDKIPTAVSRQSNIPAIDIASFVLEGGAIELDGNGTLMAARSSVISKSRNSSLTIKQAEKYLSKYLGVRNFIWLEGVIGEDITDAHIDGIARFLNDNTILTVSEDDFTKLYEDISIDDYKIMTSAKNAAGKRYNITTLPLTKEIVPGTDGYGSYLNYYVGNKVVLVPVYADENDAAALEIIARLYPERRIVPIMVNNLFQYGGMLHCVTQQQPK